MMKRLHIKDTIKNYLYDLDDFICIYDNFLYVFNYDKLLLLSNNEIIIKIKKNTLKIIGNDMLLKKMTKQELLINGIIKRMEFINE